MIRQRLNTNYSETTRPRFGTEYLPLPLREGGNKQKNKTIITAKNFLKGVLCFRKKEYARITSIKHHREERKKQNGKKLIPIRKPKSVRSFMHEPQTVQFSRFLLKVIEKHKSVFQVVHFIHQCSWRKREKLIFSGSYRPLLLDSPYGS